MQIDDEVLMAFADGELAGAEREAVASAVKGDPLLQARLKAFTETRARLGDLSEPVGSDPRDAALIALINSARDTRDVHSSDVHSSAKPSLSGWFGRHRPEAANLTWRPYAAAAVAAFAVLGLGWQLGSNDPLPATGLTQSVIAALESTPSGQDALDGNLTMIASYNMADGSFCREYQMAEPALDAVIACRQAGGWEERLVVAAQASEGFAPASDGMEAVDRFLRDAGAGHPLSAQEEVGILSGF